MASQKPVDYSLIDRSIILDSPMKTCHTMLPAMLVLALASACANADIELGDADGKRYLLKECNSVDRCTAVWPDSLNQAKHLKARLYAKSSKKLE